MIKPTTRPIVSHDLIIHSRLFGTVHHCFHKHTRLQLTCAITIGERIFERYLIIKQIMYMEKAAVNYTLRTQ